MGVEPKIGVFTPQNGWFIMENPTKMDDLRVPLFLETSTFLEATKNRRKPRFFFSDSFIPDQMDDFQVPVAGFFQDLRRSCEFPRNFEKHPM